MESKSSSHLEESKKSSEMFDAPPEVKLPYLKKDCLRTIQESTTLTSFPSDSDDQAGNYG